MTHNWRSRPEVMRLERLAALGMLLALAGCGLFGDQSSGQWHPMGANAMNLELEVVHPSDLVEGRGAVGSDGDTATQAIERLRQDKVRKLLSIDTQSASSGGGS
jgi:type IV pilus biogenesis protein CpaD/CtpE